MKVVGCLTGCIIIYDHVITINQETICRQLQRMNDNLEAVTSALTSTLKEISDSLDEVKIKYPMNE